MFRVQFSMERLDPGSVGATVERMAEERAGGMAHLAARLDETIDLLTAMAARAVCR